MASAQQFNADEFAAHASAVVARFEPRRAEFLRRLKLRCAAAFVLLIAFPWWYGLLVSWDNENGSTLSALSGLMIHSVAGIVIVVVIVAYAVMPLFRYRHYTAQLSRAVQQDVSLKGTVFSDLFRYFGDFTFYPNRQPALKSFRDAPGMPEFDAYTAEDYLRGNMDGVSVEIAEMTFARQAKPIFHGLMIILDIDNAGMALRGKFSGKTLVRVDARGGETILATDSEEAARLLVPGLLDRLLTLSTAVRQAKNQDAAVDDRVAYALAKIAHGLGEIMAVGAKGLVNWFKTGSFHMHSTRPGMQAADTAMPEDNGEFNAHMRCAFYDDKVLITIPHLHNLFEPDSLFRPPLNADDISLAYELMASVRGVVESVLGALPKSAF